MAINCNTRRVEEEEERRLGREGTVMVAYACMTTNNYTSVTRQSQKVTSHERVGRRYVQI